MPGTDKNMATQYRHLYLPLEIKARELESKVLLASEASSRGFSAIIGHNSLLQRGLSSGALPPGLYFDKSLSRHKYHRLQRLWARGNKIASLDEESGLLSFDYTSFLRERSCHTTTELASAVFCWGTHDAENWRDAYHQFRNKIFISGSPRVDFWRYDFSGYYKEETARLRERFPNLVLIASNLSGSQSYLTLKDLLRQGRANGSITDAKDEERLIVDYNDNDRMRECFISLVKRISEEFPSFNFVVRPHPVEKVDAWSGLHEKRNVFVIFSGSITPWIQSANVIIHNGCTSAIEARAINKPVIAFEPFSSRLNREVPNALSFVARTENDVSNALTEMTRRSRAEAENYKPEITDNILGARFCNLTGRPAVERIIDQIERLELPRAGMPKFNGATWLYAKKFQGARVLDRYFKNDCLITRKYPGLNRLEIESIIEKLASIKRMYENVSVTTLYPGIFKIQSH